VDTSEASFEADVEHALIGQGYIKRAPGDYDRARCTDRGLLINFIQTTQPASWARLKSIAGELSAERLVDRIFRDINTHGTSHVLHEGVKVGGVRFDLVFFPPASTRNEKQERLAQANIFSVIRQLRYGTRPGEEEKEIDWVIFLNGLPVFAVELKNRFSHQKARHAVAQWKSSRDYREPLFRQGRCLAFFAADDEVVQFATHLRGIATVFWPFNMGKNGGGGNPPSEGYATEYLWNAVMAPSSVLALLEHFVYLVDDENPNGVKTGQRTLLFPRFHQYHAVLKAVSEARKMGVHRDYLFQHSAGSGKSNTIAWLTNMLSILHDDNDEPVFDSIIVLTDRTVLDRQLQGIIRRFQRTTGVLENIDKNAQQLKTALENGKKIIVATIQKFPVIAKEIEGLPGQRFAIIIDEAHSGQGPESEKALKRALRPRTLAQAADIESDAAETDSIEERVVQSMSDRRKLQHASFFAFTATPGPKTLQLFGSKSEDGSYRPFSLYTRRQAIEEHFIMDVLQTYFTYESYWRLIKRISDDPQLDRSKAAALLKRLVSLDDHMIEQKVTIALDAFETLSKSKVGGRSKAMFLCPSRLHAVRVKQEFDRQLSQRELDYKCLVAFSGTVIDPKNDVQHTEQSMNGIPERETATAFATDTFRLLVVANKFQTGFDQPLLHTMIVDKRLRGHAAVQSLERLNRIHVDKEDTLVIDFVNQTDEIRRAFEQFHDETYLAEGADPEALIDLETRIRAHSLFETSEIVEFASIWFADGTSQASLHPLLARAIERYEEADEETRNSFRRPLAEYVRIYGFLVQLIDFVDTELEVLYLWARLLLTKLPTAEGDLPVGLQSAIDLESLRVRKTGEHELSLSGGRHAIEPVTVAGSLSSRERTMAPLSAIIKDLNDHFGIELTEEDRVTLLRLEARLDENAGLETAFDINPEVDAKLSFDQVAEQTLAEMLESNVKLLRTVANEDEIRERLLARLFQRYVARHHERGELTSERRRMLGQEIPVVSALFDSGDTDSLAAHVNRTARERGRRLAAGGRRRG
jgi:type I restriction enzyme R subunit